MLIILRIIHNMANLPILEIDDVVQKNSLENNRQNNVADVGNLIWPVTGYNVAFKASHNRPFL